MPTYSDSGAPILAPETVGALVVEPVLAQSVAAQVSTTVTTPSHAYRIPVVAADPNSAWLAEGDEITPSDPTLDEITVTPAKVGGLTIISRELAEDSSPAAAEVVGAGLARDISRNIDSAFFGALAAPAPSGLEALTGTGSVVQTGGAWLDTGPFINAQSIAEGVSAEISAFVANPSDVLALAMLKEASGSNRNLLQPDPTQANRRTIAGVPLYSSPAVTAGHVWALPTARVFFVVRDDTRVEVSREAYFSSDRVGIKCTMRVAFGYPHAAAIVRIDLTA